MGLSFLSVEKYQQIQQGKKWQNTLQRHSITYTKEYLNRKKDGPADYKKSCYKKRITIQKKTYGKILSFNVVW